MIDYLSLLFAFVLEYRVLLLFCSNPDALGVDESEKGIFSSLKSITQFPPNPPRNDDRLGDSTAGTGGSPAAEEAGKKSPIAGTGEWLYEVESSGFLLCFC